MKHLSIDETTLKELQTFESVEAMNESIKLHKQAHELSETDRNVLDAISRYACKYAGVSYLSKQKIAEDAGYKSRRTAIRSCKRLEALGIIVQHETRRIKGDRRRSSNVIVIASFRKSEGGELVHNVDDQSNNNDVDKQEVDTEVTSHSHRLETPAKANNTSNTYIDTNARAEPSTGDIIKRGLRNALPSAIYDALEPFYD